MTKLEKKIIILLSDYPESEFYGQEIARKVGCSKASVSGILKLLVEKKLVSKKVKGHMKFYQINQNALELKRFKLDLVLDKLKPIIAGLEKISKKIVLFGSASRGEQMFNSDIDLFVLTNEKEEVRAQLKKINPKLQIKAVVKTPSQWSEAETLDPEFYHEVKNGITLFEYVTRI
jgi:predicted nucleotidyltransferase